MEDNVSTSGGGSDRVTSIVALEEEASNDKGDDQQQNAQDGMYTRESLWTVLHCILVCPLCIGTILMGQGSYSQPLQLILFLKPYFSLS